MVRHEPWIVLARARARVSHHRQRWCLQRARAGRRAVVEYLAIARDSGAAAVDLWASHVTSLAERRLTVALASALDSLGSGLEPRGPVGGAVVRLGDRVVRQAIVAISEQTQ